MVLQFEAVTAVSILDRFSCARFVSRALVLWAVFGTLAVPGALACLPDGDCRLWRLRLTG